MFINAVAGVIAKIAGASTVAQATAGLGIAVAGVTGAGAAGVLPAPVQDTVASAVHAVTPFDMPHSAGHHATEHSPAPATPAVSSTTEPAETASSPAAIPSASEAEAESHSSEAEGSDHQHRGGRATSTSTRTSGSGRDDSTRGASVSTAPSGGDDASDDHGGSSDRGSGGHSGSDG